VLAALGGEVSAMTENDEHRYIDEGFRSYSLNKGDYINPHPRDTDRYNLFERGWIQAQKRTPGAVVREWESRKIADAELERAKKERKKQVETELYRKQKGY
jgi:hypothetical protein